MNYIILAARVIVVLSVLTIKYVRTQTNEHTAHITPPYELFDNKKPDQLWYVAAQLLNTPMPPKLANQTTMTPAKEVPDACLLVFHKTNKIDVFISQAHIV
jgi:hypothetical protein